MELIKPPIPARDIYYKAGAILSFPSLPWIQLGWRERARETPGASHPKPPPGPSQPFQHGDPMGDRHEAQVAPRDAALTDRKPWSKGREVHYPLSLLLRELFLLLEALTKILGRQGEIRQQLSIPLPGLDPLGASEAVAAAFLG